MTDLPPDDTRPGHEDHHAQLKADYDARNSKTPLPILFGGLASHERIHELLALDYNVDAGRDAMSTKHQQLAADHVSVHNALDAAYNARAEHGGSEKVRPAAPKVDLDVLFAEADRSSREERMRGAATEAAQWESIMAAAATLRTLQMRKAKHGAEDA
jgi:hypothetical protein